MCILLICTYVSYVHMSYVCICLICAYSAFGEGRMGQREEKRNGGRKKGKEGWVIWFQEVQHLIKEEDYSELLLLFSNKKYILCEWFCDLYKHRTNIRNATIYFGHFTKYCLQPSALSWILS